MKKVFLTFAVVAIAALSSCGEAKKATDAAAEGVAAGTEVVAEGAAATVEAGTEVVAEGAAVVDSAVATGAAAGEKAKEAVAAH